MQDDSKQEERIASDHMPWVYCNGTRDLHHCITDLHVNPWWFPLACALDSIINWLQVSLLPLGRHHNYLKCQKSHHICWTHYWLKVGYRYVFLVTRNLPERLQLLGGQIRGSEGNPGREMAWLGIYKGCPGWLLALEVQCVRASVSQHYPVIHATTPSASSFLLYEKLINEKWKAIVCPVSIHMHVHGWLISLTLTAWRSCKLWILKPNGMRDFELNGWQHRSMCNHSGCINHVLWSYLSPLITKPKLAHMTQNSPTCTFAWLIGLSSAHNLCKLGQIYISIPRMNVINFNFFGYEIMMILDGCVVKGISNIIDTGCTRFVTKIQFAIPRPIHPDTDIDSIRLLPNFRKCDHRSPQI